ncbi:MAG: NAD(P)/FAD-dependent oxidoreductase [Microthrixaceae bacterium]
MLWLDNPGRPEEGEPLSGDTTADLVVVGAGFTGLWAALQAVEDRSQLDVLVIDAGEVAGEASGRNGGFVSASLTHGIQNGVERFGDDLPAIEAAARANFDGLVESVRRHEIDAGLRADGALQVADRPWQLPHLRDAAEQLTAHGEQVTWLDADALRAQVDSPTYLGGLWQHTGEALVDPARLAWGLAVACRRLGVRIAERTRLTGLERNGAGVLVRTDRGTVRCGAVVLGTNAFRSPVRAINRRVVPVFDHVLATEPLSPAQRDAIRWRGGQGISDSANQFHYYRMTEGRPGEGPRIVWGGYDAIFHTGGRIRPEHYDNPATTRKLAEHFFTTFPQLEGISFTHRWGGVIDTSTRFSVGFGTALDGRVAWAAGYTGLGVGATRFGARVCLDLLYRPESELLELALVRKGLVPFPPEPLRSVGIQLTRRAIARADERDGRRGPWLRLLDSLGLGFDS